MIHATSRDSLARLGEQVDAVTGETDATELLTVAQDLYGVAQILTGQSQLRRLLADGSTDPHARTGLLTRLLGNQVSAPAMRLLGAAVESRWSTAWDLNDAVELAGDRVLFGQAQKQVALDEVEDELFRFGRIVDGDDRLRGLLDDATVPGERRAGLLATLLRDKVNPVSAALLDHALRSTRKRSIVLAVDDLLEEAARRRDRSTAVVRSAVDLTDEQESRLAGVLSRMYGRDVSIRTQVDPAVEGGLIVRLGDELIDGSVASRLATVRGALVR